MTVEHPAGVGGLDLWFGVECEGQQMAGLMTAFVARQLPPEALARLDRAEHIFITERFEDWGWLEAVLLPIAVAAGVPVTVAVPFAQVQRVLSMPFAGRIRLMVRVDVQDMQWFELLRAGDEVSIGVPYHLAVAERGAFTVARPPDYERDAT